MPGERRVQLCHRDLDAQRGHAGHGIFGQAARHDASEMGQVGVDIDRKTMKRDPTPHPDAQRAVLTAVREMELSRGADVSHARAIEYVPESKPS